MPVFFAVFPPVGCLNIHSAASHRAVPPRPHTALPRGGAPTPRPPGPAQITQRHTWPRQSLVHRVVQGAVGRPTSHPHGPRETAASTAAPLTPSCARCRRQTTASVCVRKIGSPRFETGCGGALRCALRCTWGVAAQCCRVSFDFMRVCVCVCVLFCPGGSLFSFCVADEAGSNSVGVGVCAQRSRKSRSWRRRGCWRQCWRQCQCQCHCCSRRRLGGLG